MDNDDYRRGKLTNHKVFGEGIAVLAGDALLTQAFEIAAQGKGRPALSAAADHAGTSARRRLASADRRAGGGLGGRGQEDLRRAASVHSRAQDLRAALLLAPPRRHERQLHPRPTQALADFGYNVGLAFQIIDDILDVTQTSEQLGKTAGKDTRAQKATYPSIVGLESIPENGGGTDRPGLCRAARFSRARPPPSRRWPITCCAATGDGRKEGQHPVMGSLCQLRTRARNQ